MVAISAGDLHALALKSDGTVVSWGYNWAGQTNVPPGLTNAMAVAAGSLFSLALRNDGTVAAWGDNTFGQTNVPAGLGAVKSISAAGARAIADIFAPTVMYPVDVTKDLLLIYNTNSADSKFVKDYYLAHRPMVSGANVLGVGCPNRHSFFPDEYTNLFAAQVVNWLTDNPTKRPQYVVRFLGIPWRVNTNALVMYDKSPSAFGDWPGSVNGSVQWRLSAWCASGWHPFVTAINMSDTCPDQPTTNACVGYINKLTSVGTNNPPGTLIISGTAGGYGNTNYYFDDSNESNACPGVADQARSGVLAVNPEASVVYTNGWDYSTNLSLHITNGANVAGYICCGIHSALGNEFPLNDRVKWEGNSGWWIIQTIESFNGQPCGGGMSNFYQWFSTDAFGGTNYSYTPVGAVTHVDEPYGSGGNDPYRYFGLWEAGKNSGICAWNSRITPVFQAVGDPFVTK